MNSSKTSPNQPKKSSKRRQRATTTAFSLSSLRPWLPAARPPVSLVTKSPPRQTPHRQEPGWRGCRCPRWNARRPSSAVLVLYTTLFSFFVYCSWCPFPCSDICMNTPEPNNKLCIYMYVPFLLKCSTFNSTRLSDYKFTSSLLIIDLKTLFYVHEEVTRVKRKR